MFNNKCVVKLQIVFPELLLDRHQRTIGTEAQSLSCHEQGLLIQQLASVISHCIRTRLAISGTPATGSDQIPNEVSEHSVEQHLCLKV